MCCTHTEGYTAVVMVANDPVAAHYNSKAGITELLSLTGDKLTAEVAARTFASARGIPFKPQIQRLTTPLYTVIQLKGTWFPAEIYSDHVRAFRGLAEGTKEDAILTATKLAKTTESHFVPSPFIKVESEQESEQESDGASLSSAYIENLYGYTRSTSKAP